ncbi:hypothetical protein R1sor_005055 [Riccia sorocarpa]|uniref:CCHC-type domain-containing protein n=1 Tax=Riccia sorocarpa TaxID=122646 RepID=A0ABD3HM98_9MARC
MLAAIGPVAYQAMDKRVEGRYGNIRGCVLIDPSLELPSKVGIRTPWLKTYMQPVIFTKLPDHCFICHTKGHWARNCPKKRQEGNPRPIPVPDGLDRPEEGAVAAESSELPSVRDAVALGGDGFEEVQPRSKSHRQEQPVMDTNLEVNEGNSFAVLAEGVHEDGEDGNEEGEGQSFDQGMEVEEAAEMDQITVPEEIGDSQPLQQHSTLPEEVMGGGTLLPVDVQDPCQDKENSVEVREEVMLDDTSNLGRVEMVLKAALTELQTEGPQSHKEHCNLTRSDPLSRYTELLKAVEAQKQGLNDQEREENPFQVGVLPFSEKTVGQEVDFSSTHYGFGKGGRGPEKKEGGVNKGKPGVQRHGSKENRPREFNSLRVSQVPEKRRALVTMDMNGCHLADSVDCFIDLEDDNQRERKLRDEDNQLKLVTWNVRGVAKPVKARAVKGWLHTKAKNVNIISLQELKVNNWSTRRWLSGIRKNGTFVFDKPHGSRGGTVLILDSSMRVIQSGIGGQGRLAWAKIQLGDIQCGVISVHAPNKRCARIEFWRNVREVMGDDNWLVTEDFNQVELREDSRGRSAVVKGSEERQWRELSLRLGLIDCFFCAASLAGTRFTRMAKRRRRIDCARLDRTYLTQGGNWLDHVRRVEHHRTRVILDHMHVSTDIQLIPEDGRRRVEGYFKMSHFDLRDPAVTQRVREAWSNEPAVVKDDRRRWARGWIRVKRVLQEVHREKEAARRSEGDLEKEIAWRKENLSEDATDAEVSMLVELEGRLRVRQLEDARVWRVRSRTKWLGEGEAPNRYFFAKLKAKYAREKLEALEEPDGEVTTDRDRILGHVHEFYSNLFSADEDSEDRIRERSKVTDLIQERLTPEESRGMSAMPDQKEIEGVVFGLKKDKAPGADGLTAEVLRLCWDFVGGDCIRFVRAVWAKKSMLQSDCLAMSVIAESRTTS